MQININTDWFKKLPNLTFGIFVGTLTYLAISFFFLDLDWVFAKHPEAVMGRVSVIALGAVGFIASKLS